MIAASDWRPIERNTLRGFCTLQLDPSGLAIHECTLHERDGARWISLPGRPQLDPDGRHRRDAAGKPMWSPIVTVEGREARERFQAAALAALDRLIGGAAP